MSGDLRKTVRARDELSACKKALRGASCGLGLIVEIKRKNQEPCYASTETILRDLGMWSDG